MSEVDVSTLKGSLRVHRTLAAYLERVLSECPGLSEALLRTWSTSVGDGVLIHEILDSSRAPVDVLDVGTFLGVSAFLFASHPQVRRVVTIDPNPYVANEINEKQDSLGSHLDPELVSGLRVHDVARSCLNQFPEVAAKVEFAEGGLRGPDAGIDLATTFRHFELSDFQLEDPGNSLIALIDGLHTADGVYGDLTAVLSVRPDAIVLLDDCRHFWGPFVQAGVARFLSEHPGTFQFHLFADLSPSLSGSPLAVLYAAENDRAAEAIGRVVSSLSIWLDPLRLLEREQDVVTSASAVFEQEQPHEMAARRRLETEVAYLRRVSAEAHRQVASAAEQLTNVSAELGAAHAQLEALRQTASWRVTRPLRRGRAMLRRHR